MPRKTRSRKKTKKKAGTGERILGLLDAVDLPRLRPYAIAAAWVIGLAGVSTAWALAVPRLARSVQPVGIQQITIDFMEQPRWVNGDLLAMLDLTARRALSGEPLDRGGLVAAHSALLNTGWFESIAQVRRVEADLVEVHAVFAEPAAVIRDQEGDHLVDSAGRLLPRTYPHGGAQSQLVITGVHFDRPQRPGVRWDGADVVAALRLLRLIDQRPWRDQVAAIDANRFLEDETLLIRTDLGARIVWGSAPGEESALEVTAEGKLAYLDRAYADFARIDTGYSGEFHFYERGYFAE